jgi:hypothetical protein
LCVDQWGKNLQFELEVEPVPVLAKLHPVFAKPFRKKVITKLVHLYKLICEKCSQFQIVLSFLSRFYAAPIFFQFHFEPGLLPDFSVPPPPPEDKELKARLKGLSGIEKVVDSAITTLHFVTFLLVKSDIFACDNDSE